MTVPIRYPLATSSWGPEEVEALQKVIQSGFYTMGPEVEKFENEFATWAGSKHCVMVNSGSSANLLMVAAMRFKSEAPLMPGDEVIVPAVSWATSYYPFTQYGLHLRFVDVDLGTLNYDIEQLESAITPRTRAILAVNLLGNPNDFNKIKNLIQDRNIYLLEDNCESLGATFEARQAGTFGLMGTFSSFFSHHISTMEGGFISTDDRELYELLLCLRAHGWTRQLPSENLISGTKSLDPFEELFKFVLPGYNLRPLEMEGAIGREQLKKLPGIIQGRRKNAAHFLDRFHDHDHFQIQREIGASSWFGFSLIIRDSSPLVRKDVVRHLGAAGIECRPIVGGNFLKNPVMKWLDHSVSGVLANADFLDRNGFFVGNQETDLSPQIDCLVDCIQQFC